MKVINQYAEFLVPIDGEAMLRQIELAGRTCYSPDTEVLTKRGFVRFDECTQEDEVLTYNQENNYLEYEPINLVVKPYNGDLMTTTHANINFKVTLDHRMIVSSVDARSYRFLSADQMYYGERGSKRSRYRVPKYFNNATICNLDYTPYLHFSAEVKNGFRKSSIQNFDFVLNDDWLTIIGAIITEGYLGDHRGTGSGSYVQITQTETNELFTLVKRALDNVGISYRIEADPRKPQVKHFKFGQYVHVRAFQELCGERSRTKHLPTWFRQLSDRQIKLLLKILYLGDGSHNTTRNEKYLSISPRLLNEVQELWILAGYNATVQYDEEVSQKCYTEQNLRDSWIISRNQLQLEHYEGLVYCSSTKNGIIVIRLDGKTLWCGNCYKSENNITPESAKKFCSNIIKSGHEAVLEHASFSVRFVTDRSVTHEIVRHRLAAYCQESQRYCNYSKDKFGNEVTFIKPVYLDVDIPAGEYLHVYGNWYYDSTNPIDVESIDICKVDPREFELDDESLTYTWALAMAVTEVYYLSLLNQGAKPEEARAVLPNSTKTELVMTADVREWRHFLKQRCDKAAHPQIRDLANQLLTLCKDQIPILFDDIQP